MRFERKFYHPFKGPFTVREVVEYECGASFSTDGSIERAAEAAENTGKMLAKLFDKLLEDGVLKVEDVEGMTGWTRVTWNGEV